MTLGDRIEEALEIAGMSVKDLEAALEEAGVDGGSYANLHRLKSDKLNRPSAGLLHGIARATNVDPVWLVSGDREPTTERERRKAISEEAVSFLERAEGGREWKAAQWIKWATLNSLGIPGPDLTPADPDTFAEELEAWAQGVNVRNTPYWVSLVAEAHRRLNVDVDTLGNALKGPLAALDLDADAMTREEVGDYISAMIPVLLTLESHGEQEDDHATE